MYKKIDIETLKKLIKLFLLKYFILDEIKLKNMKKLLNKYSKIYLSPKNIVKT